MKKLLRLFFPLSLRVRFLLATAAVVLVRSLAYGMGARLPLRTGGFTMPVSFNKLPANQTTVNRLNCEVFKNFSR
ncbi:hypothetical protein NVE80_16360 [Escherichia coli]|nr:hypothetical protein [Escherichia coli]